MFAGNALWWWASQIRAGDVVRWPYLAASIAPIDERDIAAVATIGAAIGRSLRIEEMSPDETRREWLALWPASVVNMLLDSWAAAIGQPAFTTSTFAEIVGAPPRTFLAWATDHAADFQA